MGHQKGNLNPKKELQHQTIVLEKGVRTYYHAASYTASKPIKRKGLKAPAISAKGRPKRCRYNGNAHIVTLL